MAFIPAVVGLIGATVSAAGTIAGGMASAKAADYQSQVAKNNAITANQNAAYAAHAGQTQAEDASRKEASKASAIKAAMAANGVDVNTGSDLNVQESQREEGLLTAQNVEQNALLTTYGYRTQATGYTAEADLKKSEASSDMAGSAFGAAGSLLSNASSIGFKNNNFGMA